jgi:hypothetical protein
MVVHGRVDGRKRAAMGAESGVSASAREDGSAICRVRFGEHLIKLIVF